MECKDIALTGDGEFLREFYKRSVQLRVPLSGSLEITSLCNLKCVHCYLGTDTPPERKALKEMSTAKILAVLDEITEAGCLDLLLTGGEPFLRKDFNIIYSHAKKNGLLVTVFSNGTLVTDKIVSLFEDLPPQAVEISLYGATGETYEKISGVRGSYDKCLKGIQLLLDANINLKLKTILMTLNRHEFFLIENFAKERGVKFRFDAMIFPKLNGDKSPIGLRISPEEAIEKEFSDNERFSQWKKYFERLGPIQMEEALYSCGAGITGFHIDACGKLKPCLMTTSPEYDLKEGPFSIGWREVLPLIREKKPENSFRCGTCSKAPLCGYCPPFFALENGREDICSEFLCEIGANRFKKLHN